jgi:outer membrane receptor protein involved in Fe transport
VTAGASYRHPVTDAWDGFVTVDGKYSSSYQVGSDEDPVKMQKGFGLVNGSIGVSTHDQRLTLTAWATNLFDKGYKQTAYDGVLQTFSTPPAADPSENNYYAFPGEPRFYGASLKVRY